MTQILYVDLVITVRPTVRNNVDDINLTGRHDILKILHKKGNHIFFISNFSPYKGFVTLNHPRPSRSDMKGRDGADCCFSQRFN